MSSEIEHSHSRNSEVFDNVEHFRDQHKVISERLEELGKEGEMVRLLDEQQCRRMFGLGALLGRRKYLRRIKEIEGGAGLARGNYEGNIANAMIFMQEIREEADMRQYLVACGAINRQEAGQLLRHEILDRLNIYHARVSIAYQEAEKIHNHIRAGRMSAEEAQSREVDDHVLRVDAELARHRDKFYDPRGPEDRPGPINLCFVRRTDHLPAIEEGKALVLTPFSAIEESQDPHFARVSSHWSINRIAADASLYGSYGANVVILCEGDRFIEENGAPRRLTRDDIYWLHDIILPQGTKIYIREGAASREQIHSIELAGLEVHKLSGQETLEYFDSEVRSWGYNLNIDDQSLRQFAGDMGADYGRHQGEPAGVAVSGVNRIIGAIEIAEREGTPEAVAAAADEYKQTIEEVRSTLPTNPRCEEQIKKIIRILGPVIEALLRV